MRIFFIRHGDAIDDAPSDSARPLSEIGRKEVIRVAKGISRMGIEPTDILSSPRVRAQQTAEIISEVLGTPVDIRDELDFDFDIQVAGELLTEFEADADVFLVGHNPSMSEVVRACCGANITMRTGAVACVRFVGTRVMGAELLWYAPPKMFKK